MGLFAKLLKLLYRKRVGGFVPLPKFVKGFMDRYEYPKNRQILVYARLAVGADLSHLVGNEIACAESVSRVIRAIDKSQPIITGTYTFLEYMTESRKFIELKTPVRGCIIISATGTGNGSIRGHIGIYQDKYTIFSNDSATGKWSQNFNLLRWKLRYGRKGGFAIHFFMPV